MATALLVRCILWGCMTKSLHQTAIDLKIPFHDVDMMEMYRSHAPAWECRLRRSSVAFHH
jgi:hypothetical protein